MLRKEKEEYKDIEDFLIKNGWEKGNKFDNSEYSNITTNIKKYFWLDEFKKQFFKINNTTDEKIFKKVLDELNNKDEIEVLKYFKEGIPIKDNKTKQIKHYKLFDYENIENNSFVFFHELQFGDVRPDYTLFINGIPIIIIEAKSQEIVFDKGNDQIRRYQKEEPELFKYVQFAIVYGFRKRYIPTRPNGEQGEIIWRENNKETIPTIINKNRILEFIQYFIFYKNDKSKIVARYIQYYATKKIIERIKEYLEGKSEKRKGLIWHWQGSGKTYTMFFTANYFYNIYKSKNPIIFFVVDRKELEEQMDRVYKEIFESKVEKIDTINKLKDILETIKKNEENERLIEKGLYILMIHKFSENLDFNEEIKKKEILFLIDEAHRTQYGELKAKLNKIFKNAMQFGFTGTPVFKRERKNTFQEFSYPDELYLHVYFIKQSIEDGFTLPIKYKRIAEKDLEIQITEEELKEIIEKYKEDIDPEKIEKSINRKLLMTSQKRLNKLAKYIYENIREDTENFKYKALVVVADREACVKIKKALDQYFKEDETEIVMTYQHNDKDIILEYKKQLFEKYGIKKPDEIDKKIKENFIKEENPKILIVTDMLLTGFDCPKLKVMYLDKFLYEHRLLQAIARTNRPYKDKKFGLIVDSAGILKHIKKIMKKYNAIIDEKIQNDVIENMFSNIDDEFDNFVKEINRLKETLKDLKVKDIDLSIDIDQIKENLNKQTIDELKSKLEYFVMFLKMSEEEKNLEVVKKIYEVYSNMKKVVQLYNALGSYPKKLEYKKDIGVVYYLTQIISWYLKKGKKTKKEILNEIKQYIEDKFLVDLFDKMAEVSIHKETQFGKEDICKNASASLKTIFFRLDNLYKFRHNPIYKELKIKLDNLIDKWNSEKYEDLVIIEEIKNLNKEISEFESEYKNISSSVDEIKKYLIKEYNINSDELEKVFNKIIKNKKLLPEDIKQIRTILLKKLIKNKNLKEAKSKLKELENYIIERLKEDGIEIKEIA